MSDRLDEKLIQVEGALPFRDGDGERYSQLGFGLPPILYRKDLGQQIAGSRRARLGLGTDIAGLYQLVTDLVQGLSLPDPQDIHEIGCGDRYPLREYPDTRHRSVPPKIRVIEQPQIHTLRLS